MRNLLLYEFKYLIAKIVFIYILRTLKIYIRPNCSNSIFFRKENDNIVWLEFKTDTGYLWISNDLIWSKFEDNFGFEYSTLSKLYKNVAESVLGLKQITPAKFVNTVVI